MNCNFTENLNGRMMKKYSAELISFGLLVCGTGLSLGSGSFYSGRISCVERGRGGLARERIL